MPKILIIVNDYSTIFYYRKELLIKLIDEKNEIIIACPYHETLDFFVEKGVKVYDTKLIGRSANPFEGLRLIRQYKMIMKLEKPDLVLTFTIKPNIYGGLAAKSLKIPYFANITGLGTALGKKGLLQIITKIMYKKAFKKIDVVFFQNEENKIFFEKNKLSKGKHILIPGSGVNLDRFVFKELPFDDVIKFIFISRLMKLKGIDYYMSAAEKFKKIYKDKVEFHICGLMDKDYEDIVRTLSSKKTIIYHGLVNNIEKIIEQVHVIIHPTFYPEGMSNVLLESAAMGRAIITTNRSGTKEIVDDGINGYLIEAENQTQLDAAIQRYINLSFEEKRKMGIYGRKKVEKNFNRKIVIDTYLKEIDRIVLKKF